MAERDYDREMAEIERLGWYGTPGEHYGPEDPPGDWGPYGSNGGLCQCH